MFYNFSIERQAIITELFEYEKKHIEKLRKLVPECMVLLKSNGNFPLEECSEIALFGNGARHTVKGGTGSGDVNVRHFDTIEAGLEKAGFKIVSKDWLNNYDKVHETAHKKFIKQMKRKILTKGISGVLLALGSIMKEPEYNLSVERLCETAVYILSRTSGEGCDRENVSGDFKLTQTEIDTILKLENLYKNFILVLNVGGVIDLSPVYRDVSNILLISQPGMTVGNSLADVLLGKSYPSGKLSSTWATYDDYCHKGDFGNPDDTRYKEGIYVGYRYFDSVCKKPLFPFGFGLSYTDFDIKSENITLDKTIVRVNAIVRNIGKFPGKEVLQLYVSQPSGNTPKPSKVLAAFIKTDELKPGETQNTTLNFDLKDIASFDTATNTSLLEKGNYFIHLGNSCANTAVVGAVNIPKDVVVFNHQPVKFEVDFDDYSVCAAEQYICENITQADISNFSAVTPNKKKTEISEFIKGLSDSDLAYLCIGGFEDSGSGSVIGNAGIAVAGAAGETTSRLKDKGVPAVIMADGPAGLRLSRVYGRDENGVYSIDHGSIGEMMEMIPKPILALIKSKMKNNRNGSIHYQYCSAIPVGTAIAQSWNINLCEECGDIVGDEMERFNVHLWLAPALNIHRNPLCGRNFEYYSEDPLLSGKMAAAVTRGVQKHKGKGVVIKHFACNNQETNRFRSNSIMSVKTLREIYLKGFEIAIKESEPVAVMTSYNLLCGEHTSQCCDLLETILRDEWGYDGTVISDWVTSGFKPSKKYKYPNACAHGSIKAGNDLMMPGGKTDYENIMSALNNKESDYPLSRDNLEKCAERVIRLVRKLT